MTPPLFLLDDIAGSTVGAELHLAGDEGHHAARVKRVRVGEQVLIGDGAGTLLRCEVRSIIADDVLLRVAACDFLPTRQPRLVVVQALAKGDRAELAVEMMTELGVDQIVPWAASRSVVRWRGDRGDRALARWRSTTREAAKQSRRPRIPQLESALSTDEVATVLTGAAAALVLHENAGTVLSSVGLPASGDVVVVVGPEGGIDLDELAAFERAGGCPVRLGAEVLRTSTAGAAALSVLSARLDRWT